MKIPKIGDLLIITTKKSDGKAIACIVKEVVNRDVFILADSSVNSFNFDSFLRGESWIVNIENIGGSDDSARPVIHIPRSFSVY